MNGGVKRLHLRRPGTLLCVLSSLLAAMATAHPTPISPANGAGADTRPTSSPLRPADRRQLLPEEEAPPSFPTGCSWECYLANYIDLTKNLEHTEEAALGHYLRYGIKEDRDCTCKDDTVIVDESLKEIEEVEEQLIGLDFQDDDSVKSTVEQEKGILEEKEQEMILDSFPPGCSWECYRANYIHFSKWTKYDNEAKVLSNYLHHGIKEGRDCTCKDNAEIVDESLKEIEEIEEQLKDLDFQDDDSIKSTVEQEKEILEEKEEDMIQDSFPPGCTWECYRANYIHFSKWTQYDNEAKVLSNYLHHGIKEGRDCTCRDNTEITDKSLKQIEEVEEQLKDLDFQDDDSIKSTVEQEKEILEEKEEEMIQDSFPPGCTWECYRANYIAFSKWTQYDNEAKVLSNYLHHGVKEGRDCTCRDNTEITDDETAKEINVVEEELVQLDFQDDDNVDEKISELELLREELNAVKEHQQKNDISFMITWMIVVTVPIVFYVLLRRRQYLPPRNTATEEHGVGLSKIRELV